MAVRPQNMAQTLNYPLPSPKSMVAKGKQW